MELSRQDAIWNRACLQSGGACLAIGDQMLASLLLAHSLAMNGGVVHALRRLSQSEVTAAVAGFEFFGLSEASYVFRQTPDDSEATEDRLNEMYWAAVPSDDTVSQAFRVKLRTFPEAFASTGSETHT